MGKKRKGAAWKQRKTERKRKKEEAFAARMAEREAQNPYPSVFQNRWFGSFLRFLGPERVAAALPKAANDD